MKGTWDPLKIGYVLFLNPFLRIVAYLWPEGKMQTESSIFISLTVPLLSLLTILPTEENKQAFCYSFSGTEWLQYHHLPGMLAFKMKIWKVSKLNLTHLPPQLMRRQFYRLQDMAAGLVQFCNHITDLLFVMPILELQDVGNLGNEDRGSILSCRWRQVSVKQLTHALYFVSVKILTLIF